jgi:hypothetical protein
VMVPWIRLFFGVKDSFGEGAVEWFCSVVHSVGEWCACTQLHKTVHRRRSGVSKSTYSTRRSDRMPACKGSMPLAVTAGSSAAITRMWSILLLPPA